jgi:hypothetical protein
LHRNYWSDLDRVFLAFRFFPMGRELAYRISSQPRRPGALSSGCSHSRAVNFTTATESAPFVVFTYSSKIAVFWVVAPCSLIEVYHHRPDDGGSKDL